MKGYISIVVFLCIGIGSLFSQDGRKILEKERNKIIKEIERAANNLKSNQSDKKATIKDLKAIENQIKNRQKLMGNIKKQLSDTDREITANADHVNQLDERMVDIKGQYLDLLRYAYLKDLTESKWLYILSASNLNESILRWRYLRQFENYTLRKADEITQLSTAINEKTSLLEQEKNLAASLLAAEKENFSKLEKDQKQKDKILKSLKKQESSLRKDLKKKQKEREKLNQRIEAIIVAELRKSKLAVKKPSASTSSTSTATTSAAIAKKKVLWPVKGYISSKFGKQAHPTIPTLSISNNGVDITTTGSKEVRCIAAGKVIGVTSIPGYDQMVIIQHGRYYSVYSKLKNVVVKKDDNVSSRSKIGTLTAEGILHFELWKDKKKLNPQQWLTKK